MLFVVAFTVVSPASSSSCGDPPRRRCRVAVLDKVTDFLLFLGKLLIVGIVGTDSSVLRLQSRLHVVESSVVCWSHPPSVSPCRDLLLLLLLWKDQSCGGDRAVSQLLLGPHTGEGDFCPSPRCPGYRAMLRLDYVTGVLDEYVHVCISSGIIG